MSLILINVNESSGPHCWEPLPCVCNKPAPNRGAGNLLPAAGGNLRAWAQNAGKGEISELHDTSPQIGRGTQTAAPRPTPQRWGAQLISEPVGSGWTIDSRKTPRVAGGGARGSSAKFAARVNNSIKSARQDGCACNPLVDRRYAALPSRSDSRLRSCFLRSLGSSQRLRSRMLSGVISTSSSSLM